MHSLRLTSLAFVLVATAVPTDAVEAQGATLAFAYDVTVKPGSAPAFEAAWKEHLVYREANGETWSWNVYVEAFGDTPGNYVIRSNSHTWAELDTYLASDFSALVDTHVGATILPLIESFVSRVESADAELSHLPDDLSEINIFAVTTIQLEASQSPAFEASLTAFHEAVVATGHPLRYGILRPLYGGSGPAITFVGFSPNFAGLEETDPTIDAMMVEHFGAERAQEVLEGILGGIESTQTRLYQIRRDLSTAGN